MEYVRTKPDPISPPLVATIVTAVVLIVAGAAWYLWPQPDAPSAATCDEPCPR